MTGSSLSSQDIKILNKDINIRANRVIEPVLWIMLLFGLFLAFFYSTWLVAIAVGSLCVVAFYTTKLLLPHSNLYQYVFASVSTIFSAQYIYQMHGMAEMHFWVFISSTLLIIFQNWRLQIPVLVIVYIHHSLFAWLQYTGVEEIYFTQLDYMDLVTFIFHAVLATVICTISGLWSYTIRKQTIRDAENFKILSALQRELVESNTRIMEQNDQLLLSEEELKASSEELLQINENLNMIVADRTMVLTAQNEKLREHAFINAHKVRSPLARIQGLVNLIGIEMAPASNAQDLLKHLKTSTDELDKVLVEVRVNLESDDDIPAPSDN